ncbi:MAG: twin-arginine translocase TatA/TatE family subunit [Blastocatellia bacterium]|nr:twin-arginine translocase TatA/TatE family subunit [Blastocatellia bacterium]MBL8195309.1 twin-arginine translocase TatA/TatE family subunit [Blastocatellia bacterium]MBN8725218.1 twin-arginine translocase TatA/TatE family subunit [Acidobacteriota bacterium]
MLGLFLFPLGPTEMIVILVILVVLFGGKKIPELASGLGEGIKNFKKSMNDDPDADKEKVARIEETSKSK